VRLYRGIADRYRASATESVLSSRLFRGTKMSNQLLDLLSKDDLALLKPYLIPQHLKQHTILFESGDEIQHVYFPTTAVVSLVVVLSTGETVEAAMVGRDGVVGASAALDGKISLSRGIIQLGGDAIICNIDKLKAAALASPTLLSLLIRHEQTVYAQAQQSAACLANHNIESRMSRWMLRARDLSQSDTLLFTQEFLGEMLGVRRNSVTVVAHTLQSAGLIKYSRGKVEILDIDALQESSCECYGTVRGYYDSLLGYRRNA
jgi:CRP-like cAMP-binding protein